MDSKNSAVVSEKLATELLTHGMRHIFVKLYFPRLVSRINLEGTPEYTCYEILSEIKRQGMFKELHEGMSKLFPKENFDYILEK